MERHFDEIDRQAAREGDAIRRLSGYSPEQPNNPNRFGKPNRIFNTGLCSRIERLESTDYKKELRRGSLKTL